MARLTPDVIAARLKMLKKVQRELAFWWKDSNAERKERIQFAAVGRRHR